MPQNMLHTALLGWDCVMHAAETSLGTQRCQKRLKALKVSGCLKLPLPLTLKTLKESGCWDELIELPFEFDASGVPRLELLLLWLLMTPIRKDKWVPEAAEQFTATFTKLSLPKQLSLGKKAGTVRDIALCAVQEQVRAYPSEAERSLTQHDQGDRDVSARRRDLARQLVEGDIRIWEAATATLGH